MVWRVLAELRQGHSYVTTWLTPRHSRASRPFPVGEMLTPPTFKRDTVPPHHRDSLSIVGHCQQPVSTAAVGHHSLFEVFSHTVAFGNIALFSVFWNTAACGSPGRTRPLLAAYTFVVPSHTVAFGRVHSSRTRPPVASFRIFVILLRFLVVAIALSLLAHGRF